MLRFLTAGESHGKCLMGVLEGLPRGIAIDIDFIDSQLHRRQLGYGRGGRMKIERDKVEIASGVRHGYSLGSPISFTIRNKDWEHWQIPMCVHKAPKGSNLGTVAHPRPGHADLAGSLKYQTQDARDILERASARETAARVAAGAFCRLFLAHFGVQIGSHVLAIGKAAVKEQRRELNVQRILALDPESPVRCADPQVAKRMMAHIDEAKENGDTLGGVAEIVAKGVPPGLGSHIQWDLRLDGQISQAMMSIPAVKAVEIGRGVSCAGAPGSAVHDEIFYNSEAKCFYRNTNRAGGVEGGISNGSDVRTRIHIKPIPTLRKSLRSVDLRSKNPFAAAFERSDTCVVPAAGVVGEAMLALVLAKAFLDKFGGDSIKEIEGNFGNYMRLLNDF